MRYVSNLKDWIRMNHCELIVFSTAIAGFLALFCGKAVNVDADTPSRSPSSQLVKVIATTAIAVSCALPMAIISLYDARQKRRGLYGRKRSDGLMHYS